MRQQICRTQVASYCEDLSFFFGSIQIPDCKPEAKTSCTLATVCGVCGELANSMVKTYPMLNVGMQTRTLASDVVAFHSLTTNSETIL